jgi:hypothetical protein
MDKKCLSGLAIALSRMKQLFLMRPKVWIEGSSTLTNSKKNCIFWSFTRKSSHGKYSTLGLEVICAKDWIAMADAMFMVNSQSTVFRR